MQTTLNLMTSEELAKLCHVAPDTVRYWRHIGTGPKYFRMGGKRIFYRQEDVKEWIAQQYARDHPESKTSPVGA